jgi:hypothetical protein
MVSKGQVNGIALGAIGVGSVLVWSGVQNQKITKTIQDIVSGKQPKPGPKPAAPPSADIASLTVAQQQALGNLGGNPRTAPGVSTSLGVQKNQAIGKVLATAYGWGSGPNWDALVILWNSESGWNNTIWNSTAPCGGGAHAYGIPQACGHGPPSSSVPYGNACPYPAGNPGNPPVCGGISSATAQIAWGLNYIRQNYGQPVNVPLGGY